MTTLHPLVRPRPLRLRTATGAALFTLLIACSGGGDPPGDGSAGGASSGSGGGRSGGASSGGASAGGMSGSGNAPAGSGGTSPSNGQSGAAGGGAATNANAGSTNGGAPGGGSANGGSTNGGAPAGGSAGTPNAGSAGTATGGTGGGVTWTATDYVSRKWARFPIPNPASMNLPNPMSYTVTGDQVKDNVTGLVWQKSTNAATTDWPSALAYCKSLGEGWSLPTRIELTTIVDHTRSGPKVDPVFTFGKGAGWTWASTPWVVNQRRNLTGAAALSWFINFALGDANNSLSQTATSAYSRCVRVPTTQTLPAQHYSIANGEVRDNYTGLVWQQGHAGGTGSLTYDQARAYCAGLDLNGQSWRLPSVNELASIVDDVPTGDVSPAVDKAAFPATSPDLQYWTASPYGASMPIAERWTLNFEDGFTAHRAIASQFGARCVR